MLNNTSDTRQIKCRHWRSHSSNFIHYFFLPAQWKDIHYQSGWLLYFRAMRQIKHPRPCCSSQQGQQNQCCCTIRIGVEWVTGNSGRIWTLCTSMWHGANSIADPRIVLCDTGEPHLHRFIRTLYCKGEAQELSKVTAVWPMGSRCSNSLTWNSANYFSQRKSLVYNPAGWTMYGVLGFGPMRITTENKLS